MPASPAGPGPAPPGPASGPAPPPSHPHDRALARALGLPAQDGRIPWAAWHRHQQGQSPNGDAWAFVTPCQWQVSTDHVTLRNPQHPALDDPASRALPAIVSPLFADLATASLERVLQRDVRAWMPDAKAARTLHRLHSEMQMLLYTHAFNDERSERGLPVINSFWVHGTGPIPTPAPSALPTPTVPTTLRDAALNADWRAWAAAWTALDAGPVADLLRKSEGGEPVQLTLCGERNTLA